MKIKKKVTPIALRTYRNLGLLDQDEEKVGWRMLEIFSSESNELKDLLNVTFDEVPENIGDVDLAEVATGIRDFLSQWTSGLIRSGKQK